MVTLAGDASFGFYNGLDPDGNPLPDITDLDTSDVTDMNGLFFFAETFNQAIGRWDTSNTTIMRAVFYEAHAFNQDISQWNTSKVTDMREMFHKAYAFNQDIGSWDTSAVTRMDEMFFGAQTFNRDISGWDMSRITDMSDMFSGAAAFNRDISDWTIADGANLSGLFRDADAFDQDLSDLDISGLKLMYNMFNGSGMSVENYDATLNGWYEQSLSTGVQNYVALGASGLQYSSESAAARQWLTFNHGWTFQGDTLWTEGENRAPNAIIDNIAIDADIDRVVFNALSNDRDQDRDTLSLTAIDGDDIIETGVDPYGLTFNTASANGGAISGNSDGTLHYLPAPDFAGVDTFTYTVSDGNGGTDTATVRITVGADPVAPPPEPTNSAPVIAGLSFGQRLDASAFSINLRDFISDPDGDDFDIFVALPSELEGIAFDAETSVLSGTIDAGFDPYTAGEEPSLASFDIDILAIDTNGAETEVTRSLVVRQDTSPRTPTVTVDDIRLDENGAERGVIVRLSNPVDYDITLNWRISDDSTAYRGFDFDVADGVSDVFIPAGGETGLIRLTALADDIAEGLEYIEFEFSTLDDVVDNGGHIVPILDSAATDLSSGNGLLAFIAFAFGHESVAQARDYFAALYDEGVKYTASIEAFGGASVSGSGFEAGYGYSLDVADLFGVTAEGLGQYDSNENGRVSVWSHSSLSLSTALDLNLDFLNSRVTGGLAVGFTPLKVSSLNGDDLADTSVGYKVGAGLLGTKATIGQTLGTQSGVSPYDFEVSAAQSAFGVSVPLGNLTDGFGVDGAKFTFSPLDIAKLNLAFAGVSFEVANTRNHIEADRDLVINGEFLEVLSEFGLVSAGEFSASDGMSGNTAANEIVGTTGNDEITGGGGNDSLYGRNGDDLLYADDPDIARSVGLFGGEGDDVMISGRAEYWAADGGADNDQYVIDYTQLQDVADDLGRSPELQVYDESGADDRIVILSDRAIDIVNDVTYGFADDGTLTVTTANKKLFGSDDEFSFTITDQTSAHGRIENIWFATASDDLSSFNLYAGQDIASLTESHLEETAITGSERGDVLTGTDASQILNGGVGGDSMVGLGGDDTFIFENSKDRAEEAVGEGFDTIIATSEVTLGSSEIERVNLEGTGNHRVNGNQFATEINGNAGSNILIGGGGGDVITGGDGTDYFAFLVNDAEGATQITDFGGNDQVALDDRFFNLGDSSINVRQVSQVQIENALRTETAIYNASSGEMFIDVDGRRGPEEAQLIAVIEGGGKLGVDDLILF